MAEIYSLGGNGPVHQKKKKKFQSEKEKRFQKETLVSL
jgi:hypothetical protein